MSAGRRSAVRSRRSRPAIMVFTAPTFIATPNSTDLHRDADLRASAEFIQSHVRRLEAMRRQSLAGRLPDGGWRGGPDHLDRSGEKTGVSPPVGAWAEVGTA